MSLCYLNDEFEIQILILAPVVTAHTYCAFLHLTLHYSGTPLKWTPLGPTIVSAIARVSLAQGLVVDHAPPIIVANYNKARLWTTK